MMKVLLLWPFSNDLQILLGLSEIGHLQRSLCRVTVGQNLRPSGLRDEEVCSGHFEGLSLA